MASKTRPLPSRRFGHTIISYVQPSAMRLTSMCCTVKRSACRCISLGSVCCMCSPPSKLEDAPTLLHSVTDDSIWQRSLAVITEQSLWLYPARGLCVGHAPCNVSEGGQ